MQKDDVIYRQAAIDALDKRFDSVPMEQTAEILQLRKDLRELPSAQQEKVCIAKITLLEEQVREAVEKAKSEIVQVFSSEQPERKKGHWCDCWCSECGWSFEVESGFVGDPTRFLFCPNCGADMRDNKKEDEE